MQNILLGLTLIGSLYGPANTSIITAQYHDKCRLDCRYRQQFRWDSDDHHRAQREIDRQRELSREQEYRNRMYDHYEHDRIYGPRHY